MSSQAGRLSSLPIPYPSVPLLSLKAQRLLLKSVLVLSDVLVLGAAFRVAFWLRFGLQFTLAPEVVPDPRYYPSLAAILIPIWIVLFALFDLYDPHTILGGVTEYSRVFNACTTGMLFVVLATFIEPGFVVSRVFVLSSWALTFALAVTSRFCWRRVVYSLRRRGYLLVPTAIVGTNEEAEALARALSDWRASGLRILGHLSCQPKTAHRAPGAPILGGISDARRIVEENEIENVIVAVTSLNRKELLGLCEQLTGNPSVSLRLSSGVYELLTTGVTVRPLGPVPLVSLNRIRLRKQEVWVKTLLDTFLAFTGLLLLFPLLVLISILIKVDSPGPVFHRRRVLGVSGAEFDAFKFRTMSCKGDEILAADAELSRELLENHKLKQDPRITRIGRWLRKYSLDELPQLFNVLLGQMGLVGPRMISPQEARKYGRHRLNLLTVKPGITGLWQVSGRSDLSYAERVRLDMYYVRNYSVWLDLQILFVQTLPAVLRGRGAY